MKVDALHERGEESRGVIGDLTSELVSRVFTLTVGEVADPIIDAAKREAAKWLGVNPGQRDIPSSASRGLAPRRSCGRSRTSLDRKPGLYRWPRGMGQPVDLVTLDDETLGNDAKAGPLLVFIHGTASSSAGSFGDLQKIPATTTGNRSPVNSASASTPLSIARSRRARSKMPSGLRPSCPRAREINLVTHSRGGLVGDLLCLEKFSDELIESSQGGISGARRCIRRGAGTHKERSRQCSRRTPGKAARFARSLQEKQFFIQRYVRVACPARGTLLASGNFDIFLSALLTLIGRVPYLYGNPLYYAFKRIVLEIAKNRTDAKLIPGIEAMLPDSPMARFLAVAKPKESTQMAVIAGDIEGGGLLKRLGVLFTDYAFFSGIDNDLVVDTDSMYAGIARQAGGRALFDQGPATSHFHYFQNDGTRAALREWLLSDAVERLDLFKPLPGDLQEPSLAEEISRTAALRRSRGGEAAEAALPVVVVLPGIMGSHLWKNNSDRIWFDVRRYRDRRTQRSALDRRDWIQRRAMASRRKSSSICRTASYASISWIRTESNGSLTTGACLSIF